MSALPSLPLPVPVVERPVETSATHRYQLTQVLDAQPALQWHQFLDVFVDVFPPEPLLRWRRASTFCKAPFQKIHLHRLLGEQAL